MFAIISLICCDFHYYVNILFHVLLCSILWSILIHDSTRFNLERMSSSFLEYGASTLH